MVNQKVMMDIFVEFLELKCLSTANFAVTFVYLSTSWYQQIALTGLYIRPENSLLE